MKLSTKLKNKIIQQQYSVRKPKFFSKNGKKAIDEMEEFLEKGLSENIFGSHKKQNNKK